MSRDSVFEHMQVERWDAPLVRLPDRAAVRDYLIARFVPPEVASDAAGSSLHRYRHQAGAPSSGLADRAAALREWVLWKSPPPE
jgi:hypothetical protein